MDIWAVGHGHCGSFELPLPYLVHRVGQHFSPPTLTLEKELNKRKEKKKRQSRGWRTIRSFVPSSIFFVFRFRFSHVDH